MKNVIPFLKDLMNNNKREWFNDNKKRYLLAKDEFEAFISDLLPRNSGSISVNLWATNSRGLPRDFRQIIRISIC